MNKNGGDLFRILNGRNTGNFNESVYRPLRLSNGLPCEDEMTLAMVCSPKFQVSIFGVPGSDTNGRWLCDRSLDSKKDRVYQAESRRSVFFDVDLPRPHNL